MKNKPVIISILRSAFASYSRIPVPAGEWNEEDLRWQICCFPLVGAVTGGLWCAAAAVLTLTEAEPVLSAAVLTALPLFLTGGIHMDGFLDTSDAIHSWKSPAERLMILKDPHIGAFALIYGAIYLLLFFGMTAQLAVSLREGWTPCFMVWAGSVLSRICSAWSVIRFPKARKDGMLRAASDGADKNSGKVLILEMIIMILICLAGAIIFKSLLTALLPFICGAVLLYYYRMAMKYFGGVTGDLAGWFLQVCELVILAAAMLGNYG